MHMGFHYFKDRLLQKEHRFVFCFLMKIFFIQNFVSLIYYHCMICTFKGSLFFNKYE